MQENRKYLRDGRLVEVLGKLESGEGWVVSELLESYEGDETNLYPSEYAFVVSEVFDTAPIKVISQEVKKLEEKEKELQNTIRK